VSWQSTKPDQAKERQPAREKGGGIMAEIDGILSELRHRIMGPFEGGPTKPAPQEVNNPVEHSAVVALRRLTHPERDGGLVVQDDSTTKTINPGRGVFVGDDPISPLIRRLSLDMPKLMEEVVAFIERRTAELNGHDGDAPRPPESVAPTALVRAAPTPLDDDTAKTAITLLFDTRVLARIDADAKRLGIGRTAWLHVAAGDRLER
jgi:hypothetical protein